MTGESPATSAVYGLLAEFEQPDEILNAAKSATSSGYVKVEAYSPFPVHGLDEAVGFRRSAVPLFVLCGGICGCASAFLLEWFCAAYAYPLNIAGRPLVSLPAFIPVMFELTILFASFAALLSMLGLNGLPLPYHPLFNVERFSATTTDRFFLCIEAKDPKFDREKTKAFLESLKARGVYEVPM